MKDMQAIVEAIDEISAFGKSPRSNLSIEKPLEAGKLKKDMKKENVKKLIHFSKKLCSNTSFHQRIPSPSTTLVRVMCYTSVCLLD